MKLILKRILFYIISFTWGGIMSIIGAIAILILLPFKNTQLKTYHGRVYMVVGKNWGGLELGCFFLCGENMGEHTLAHECGHGLQNCLWGPLMPFVISIPSAIRYWYRRILEKKNYRKYRNLPPYDSVWFERQATEWGTNYIITDKF